MAQIWEADEGIGLKSLGLYDSDSDHDDVEKIEIKYDTYNRCTVPEYGPTELKLALVKKHHSLWAEYIYNAARILADMIDNEIVFCKGKSCLELGAGAGLPGVLAALKGASITVISDYGSNADKSLLTAIEMNIDYVNSFFPSTQTNPYILTGMPYIFGSSLDDILAITNNTKFDIILLADLIFNRSEHKKLLWTVKQALKPQTGVAWVTFSHHDPKKKSLDMNFFELAKSEFNMNVTEVGMEKRPSYPFVENDGLDDQRGEIHIYKLAIPS